MARRGWAKSQTPPLKRKAEKPPALAFEEGRSQVPETPPLKKQKKEVVEEDPSETTMQKFPMMPPLPIERRRREELLGDDFLEGSGDEEEHSDSGSGSDSDSDEGDIEKSLNLLMRKKQRRRKTLRLSCLIFNRKLETIRFGYQLKRNLKKKLVGHQIYLYFNRIKEKLCQTLASLRPNGASRKDCVEQLKSDIASYYGYNSFLIGALFELFPPVELMELIEAFEKQRLHLSGLTHSRGVNLDPLSKWSKSDLLFMIHKCQSVQPLSIWLDSTCAAPGGKTKLRLIFANEMKVPSSSRLTANLHRMGVTNTIVCNYDGRELPKVLGEKSVDRVLLDAPCSGNWVKVSKSLEEIKKFAHLQKQLLLAAIDMVDATSKPVDILCTQHNEAVIDYALKKGVFNSLKLDSTSAKTEDDDEALGTVDEADVPSDDDEAEAMEGMEKQPSVPKKQQPKKTKESKEGLANQRRAKKARNQNLKRTEMRMEISQAREEKRRA
ncbi:hypothetical protein HID58_087903 [Brassica napus]|uniref:SAM-dependent methyltransferase RsmB-F/NOP2-type catalytic core domain-containing protein n=1 Tax=Brassica napus TaxID=3708 RepID=A0ABQ7XUP1_BRANA|nr:hypothetical protein HID58_087903 [Brassica napus]